VFQSVIFQGCLSLIQRDLKKQEDEATNKISSHKTPSHFKFLRKVGLRISKQTPSPTIEKNKNGVITNNQRRPPAEQIKIIAKQMNKANHRLIPWWKFKKLFNLNIIY
jgi:hypothetical protein